jgi:t-SNARE complex subunit (syntaxin)
LFGRQVARIVGDLKEIAIDMGTEVAKQNVQIDKINEKVMNSENV